MMEHYFSKNPKTLLRRESFEANILGNDIRINSASGIFSMSRLDFGTRLLVENAKISNGANVLDLGCGYGIIGIAIKKSNANINVMMCDVNERAVRLARENCTQNNVDIKVLKSDIFSNPELHEKKFDVILTNPPFSAGKDVCIEFIRQSFQHLNKGGLLELVAPHNKGGISLKKAMLEVFDNAGELAKKSGYRVYISIKK